MDLECSQGLSASQGCSLPEFLEDLQLDDARQSEDLKYLVRPQGYSQEPLPEAPYMVELWVLLLQEGLPMVRQLVRVY